MEEELQTPRQYVLKKDYVDCPAGTVVVDFLNYDYGRAYAFHRIANCNARCVTATPDGKGGTTVKHGFFAVDVNDLEELKE